MLPEEIDKEKKELDEEAEAYNKIMEGQEAFKKVLMENKNIKAVFTKPKINGDAIEFTLTLKIPLEWIKKYTGNWNKDGVDK